MNLLNKFQVGFQPSRLPTDHDPGRLQSIAFSQVSSMFPATGVEMIQKQRRMLLEEGEKNRKQLNGMARQFGTTVPSLLGGAYATNL